MKYILALIIISLVGCEINPEKRETICKVKAELLLPLAYGDSTNVKELFEEHLNLLYPQAFDKTLTRNGIDAKSSEFSFDIEEVKHANRIIKVYLTSFVDCNCRNILDTLLIQIHSDFLKRFPDHRTIEYETKMLTISNQLDSLQRKIEEIKNPKQITEQGINLDTIEQWENEWLKLMEQRAELEIESASYRYEFFKVLNSGSSVL
jgi:hypothetical protein